MNYRSIAACLLCLVAFLPSARAEEQVETLQQLRQRYQQARDILANTAKPEFGTQGFSEKLKAWSDAYQKSQASARALIPALLNHWMTLPDDSAEAPAACKQIRAVCKDIAGHPRSEQYNIAKSFFARAVWPLLADERLTPEQATFLLELTEPQALVRMNDKEARLGRPTEPLGWNVQAANALALIRSGSDKQARDEIAILHDKVSINHKVNPGGRLDYGPEAGEARYRKYTDYLQLCELLHALQAAIANDHQAATQHIEQARTHDDVLSPEAIMLIAEVTRRTEAKEE